MATETASVIEEGERQMVLLPKGFRLSTSNVSVRYLGDAIVLEPIRPSKWPDGFFDSIHITDPAFQRIDQGPLPPVKTL
jgi:virulence-associated protein VagC